MTKVKTAASIAITPATILMNVDRSISGASRNKPIIRHHAPYCTGLTSFCCFWIISYQTVQLPTINFALAPNLVIFPTASLTAEPGENFNRLSLFCYLKLCFSIGHDHEPDQHYQSHYYPYPGWDHGYRERAIIRSRKLALVAIIVYCLNPPVVGTIV